MSDCIQCLKSINYVNIVILCCCLYSSRKKDVTGICVKRVLASVNCIVTGFTTNIFCLSEFIQCLYIYLTFILCCVVVSIYIVLEKLMLPAYNVKRFLASGNSILTGLLPLFSKFLFLFNVCKAPYSWCCHFTDTRCVVVSNRSRKTNDVTGIYVKRERFFIKQFIILSLARGCFI